MTHTVHKYDSQYTYGNRTFYLNAKDSELGPRGIVIALTRDENENLRALLEPATEDQDCIYRWSLIKMHPLHGRHHAPDNKPVPASLDVGAAVDYVCEELLKHHKELENKRTEVEIGRRRDNPSLALKELRAFVQDLGTGSLEP